MYSDCNWLDMNVLLPPMWTTWRNLPIQSFIHSFIHSIIYKMQMTTLCHMLFFELVHKNLSEVAVNQADSRCPSGTVSSASRSSVPWNRKRRPVAAKVRAQTDQSTSRPQLRNAAGQRSCHSAAAVWGPASRRRPSSRPLSAPHGHPGSGDISKRWFSGLRQINIMTY